MSDALRTLRPEPLRRFKPYPAYKDSGVEWLGEIPLGWKPFWLGRLGSFSASGIDKKTVEGEAHVSMVNYTDVYSNTSKTLDRAREYMRTTCPGQKAIEHSLRCGDILFTPSSETEEEVGFSAVVTEDMPGTVYSYHLIRFRPRAHADLDTAFSKYFCSNTVVLSQFSAACKGTTRQILTREDFKRIGVVLPPLPEQRAIAAFLDRETARIDALVAKKERLIELLQEKRIALITRAVTKGLDPTVPMKDSGVEWLGEIPAHWEVKRIKWAARMVSGHTPDKKVDSYWQGGDIPWVSLADTGQLRGVDYIATTAVMTTADGIAHSSAHVLPEGTVVFSRDATIGLCAITRAGMAVSQHFIGWVCGSRLRPEYLLFVLRSMTQELERLTMGATVLTIGMPDVRSLVTPIPPLAEQEELVREVLHRRAQLDALIAKVRDAIDHLEELRTALIAAAVTGKIDVREEAA